MNEDLFPNIDRTDLLYIPKHFFNISHTISFLRTMQYIINGIGVVVDEYTECCYSNDREPEELPWEGIKFRLFEEEVILSTSESIELLKEACLRYITLHNSKLAEVNALLAQIK
ncbi:MAG: hypothetical protein H7318_08465 [Oligoflexus sp.]|nr:hypothetical protein [Oligoflexus sp.]